MTVSDLAWNLFACSILLLFLREVALTSSKYWWSTAAFINADWPEISWKVTSNLNLRCTNQWRQRRNLWSFFWYQLFFPDFFLAASVFFCVLYGFGIYLFFSVMFLYVSFSVFLVFFCWPIFWLLLGLLACFWVFLFPLVALCARFVLFGFLRCAKDNGAEAHIGQMRS